METVKQTFAQEENVASDGCKVNASNTNEELPVVFEDGGLDCLHGDTIDKSHTGNKTTPSDQHTEEILTKLLDEVVDSVANEIKNEDEIEENTNKTEITTITSSPLPNKTQNPCVSTWRSSTGEMCEPEKDCGSDITDSEEGSFTESDDELLETEVGKCGGCPGAARRCIVVGGKIIQLPPNITVKRLTEAEGSKSVIDRRRETHLEAIREEGSFKGSPIKRKHNERMNLKEVNAADFSDTKDYVDYIQSKLANVQIKILK